MTDDQDAPPLNAGEALRERGPHNDMGPLLSVARSTGQWLRSNTFEGSLVWSPDELLAEWERGRFLWMGGSFQLCDPAQVRATLDKAITDAFKARDDFDKRLAAAGPPPEARK